MIKAVLFDLDGTLLDIDLDGFLRDYFRLLGPVIAELVGDGVTPKQALGAVLAGTDAMSVAHSDITNREIFNQTFFEITGYDLGAPQATEHLERFYRERFPSLKGVHGPRPGNGRLVSVAQDLGLATALATNPIFPLAAIEERVRWAALDTGSFDVITSYENMRACKPLPEYFLQVADALGVEPAECLMVGDDASLDLPASHVGMRTYYVGPVGPTEADWCGTLDELSELLPQLAG